jgi:transposase-like protein
MKINTHSNEEIALLNKNPYVVKCYGRTIKYTFEFKMKVLELHSQGVTSKEIWKRLGFDISKWRKGYAKDCIVEWQKLVKKRGFGGLQSRWFKDKSESSEAKKIRRLELEVRYLKTENDFLAQLRAKRAESNSGQNKNTK